MDIKDPHIKLPPPNVTMVDVTLAAPSQEGFRILTHLGREERVLDSSPVKELWKVIDDWFYLFRFEKSYYIATTKTSYIEEGHGNIEELPPIISDTSLPNILIRRIVHAIAMRIGDHYLDVQQVPSPTESLEKRRSGFWGHYNIEKYLRVREGSHPIPSTEDVHDAIDMILTETFFTNR